MTDYSQDKELLQRLARNDSKAIETLYRDHFDTTQSLIINNSGTADDAKDIFQEAMVVLYEKSKSPSFELSCQIRTYLYSVCRRLWLKRLQQLQRYTDQVESIAEVVPVEEEIAAHEQQSSDFQHMEQAMASLGEPCKSLLEAYYLQNRSMAEIAGGFGYTNADNAKNQKYKCLMRLKKLFFAQHKPR